MNQIQTQAGASAKEVRHMRGEVLQFARSGKSISGPKELADGLYNIESAGIRGKRALDALHHSEQLSMVGRTDLVSTSKILTTTMKTGMKGTQNLDETVGILNATVGQGVMKMGDLEAAISTGINPAVARAGLSLQDTGAALATMTAQGVPARQGATRFRMAISKMVAPTGKASDALSELGLAPMALARSMQKGGLMPTLRTLEDRLKKFSKVKQGRIISDIFGGGRSSSGIILLLRSMDDLEKRYASIGDKAKHFKDARDAAFKEPGMKVKAAWAQLQALMIQFGDKILPVAVKMFQKITGILTKLPKPVKKAIIPLAIVLALLGPSAWIIGTTARAIGGLIGAFVYLRNACILTRIELGALWVQEKLAALWTVTLGNACVMTRIQLGLLWVQAKLVALWSGIVRGAIIAWTAVQWLLNAALTANPIGLIIVGIAALVAAFVLAYTKVKWFRNGVNAVLTWLKGAAIWAFNAVKFAMKYGLLGPIGLVIAHFGWLKNAAKNAVNWIVNAFHNFVGFFTSLPDKFMAVANDIITALIAPFKSAINWILGAWNKLDVGIHVDIPDFVPGIGGSTFGIDDIFPDVPLLARGGTLRGQGSFITGDAGPELQTVTASGIKVQPLAAGQEHFRPEMNVRVYMDGKDITRRVVTDVRNAKARR
jgi:TP901 family phage tail tape measure protein